MKIAIVTVLASFSALACAADPGTRPHDMSAESHEAMAKQEDQAARAHSAQYDASAQSKTEACSRGG